MSICSLDSLVLRCWDDDSIDSMIVSLISCRPCILKFEVFFSLFFFLTRFSINQVFQWKTLVIKIMNIGGRAGGHLVRQAGVNIECQMQE